MIRFRKTCGAGLAIALAACNGNGDSPEEPFVPPPPPAPLTRISAASPFAVNCAGSQTGTVYTHAEVEPFAAANPVNPDNLIAVWQQDRWSNGGAQGLLAAFSTDGGGIWTLRQAPFSQCTGGNTGNGGNYARATDPWVTFSPNGVAFWMSLSFTDPASLSAMLVSRSPDGGDTWSTPITLIQDGAGFFNDKNTITADPNDPNYVYAVWDRVRTDVDQGPAWFARTTDGGDSWEAARMIYDPGNDAQTVGNVIVVLPDPDGTLLNLFTEVHFGNGVPDSASLRILRSIDQGQTWLIPPVTVAELMPVGASDPETGAQIRDGAILGQIAVSPSGELAVVWQDSRFSAGARDGIALSRSIDGGLSWSAPMAVNGAPRTQAFTPALQYASDGSLGVAYYDLRDNTSSASTLLASYWLATSSDGLTWNERRISAPFDLNLAPNAQGLFLGDYQALLAAGTDFRPFFVQTNTSAANRTDLYTLLAQANAITGKSYRLAPATTATMTSGWRDRVKTGLKRAVHRPRKPQPENLFAAPDNAVLP